MNTVAKNDRHHTPSHVNRVRRASNSSVKAPRSEIAILSLTLRFVSYRPGTEPNGRGYMESHTTSRRKHRSSSNDDEHGEATTLCRVFQSGELDPFSLESR